MSEFEFNPSESASQYCANFIDEFLGLPQPTSPPLPPSSHHSHTAAFSISHYFTLFVAKYE